MGMSPLQLPEGIMSQAMRGMGKLHAAQLPVPQFLAESLVLCLHFPSIKLGSDTVKVNQSGSCSQEMTLKPGDLRNAERILEGTVTLET